MIERLARLVGLSASEAPGPTPESGPPRSIHKTHKQRVNHSKRPSRDHFPRSLPLANALATRSPRLNYGAMALVFLAYLVAFLLVLKNKRRLAYLCFTASTLLSLLMFCYHTSSSLELNF